MNNIKQICTQLIELWDADGDADSDFYFAVKLNELRDALAEPEPEGPNNEPQIGDYVLATKWSDGDPCDHFCVGFFAGKDRDRYKVVDSDGNLFRGNGFRRCEIITQKEGESILSLKIGDKPGPSVWWHLERIRGIEVQPEPEEPTDGEVVELVAWLLEGGEDAAANGWDHQARQFARAAELLQLQHPQP